MLLELNCYANLLTILDISYNYDLLGLNCGSNYLAILDASANFVLEKLNCSQNKLSSLNLSNCKSLMELNCQENNLADIDISDCLALTFLNCSSNSVLDTTALETWLGQEGHSGYLFPQCVQSTISIGGIEIPCIYSLFDSTGALKVGSGDVKSPAVSREDAIGDLVIPETIEVGGIARPVVGIAPFAFYQCDGLTSTGLDSNSSVTSIGWRAFEGCSGLISTGLGLNSTVTTLADRCFSGCTSLTSTGYETNTTLKTVPLGMFMGCSNLITTGLESNSTVKAVGWYSFGGCSSLKNAALGSGFSNFADAVNASDVAFPVFIDCPLDSICFYGDYAAEWSDLNGIWAAESISWNVPWTAYYIS